MAAKPAQRRPSDLDLAVLAELEAAELRRLWQERRRAPPPPTLSGRLMRHVLAWEIQANEEGGESSAVRRQWQAVMTRRAGGARAEDAVTGLSAPPAAAGTRLLKSWGGETHEVLVTAENVIWKGKPYSSLSAVARAMTGTPRNGPKFFGLREDRQ
jgi:hypothetical protein